MTPGAGGRGADEGAENGRAVLPGDRGRVARSTARYDLSDQYFLACT
jgi:hypothetical protein